MEIRPGLSLLQALSRVSEPKAVPFSDRLAELRGDPAGAPAAAAKTAAPAEPPREAATRNAQGGGPRPRGSMINILV